MTLGNGRNDGALSETSHSSAHAVYAARRRQHPVIAHVICSERATALNCRSEQLEATSSNLMQ
eukprot:5086951-Alexandrium_andersonii.AAC.1